MGWETSRRRYRLPPNWADIRRPVLQEAGYVCELKYPGLCRGVATEVDHIKHGDDHSRGNLRAVCSRCHAKKSSAEGNARQRELRALRKRPEGRHPGRT